MQLQELSKIKNLVLLREQELSEKTNALKDASAQLEKLRNEVTRLRRQEELLSDVQVTFLILVHTLFSYYYYFPSFLILYNTILHDKNCINAKIKFFVKIFCVNICFTYYLTTYLFQYLQFQFVFIIIRHLLFFTYKLTITLLLRHS